jgi:phage head maturation protease
MTVGPTGLTGVAQVLDTTRARDLLTEIEAGLMAAASVGFTSNPGKDQWSPPPRGVPRALPRVLRRGAVLREISLVDIGAYESAKVTVVDPDAERHKASERELAPLRAQREREALARRAKSAELLAWAGSIPPPPVPPAAEPVDLARVIPDVPGRRGMGMPW